MKWKIVGKPESGGTSGYAECPSCKGTVWAIWLRSEFSFADDKYRFRYCPFCGERMEGDDGMDTDS